MRLLWFNLATDQDDPVLGFTGAWLRAVAPRVRAIEVISMRRGAVDLPASVRVRSLGKERGWSEPRRALEFYRQLWGVLRSGPVDACFSHMTPMFSVMAAPILRPLGVPTVTWYAHPRRGALLMAAHHLSARMVASVREAYPYRQDRLQVIGQGIDTGLFSPGERPPEEPRLVLIPGRLATVKGHDVMIAALARLRGRGSTTFRVAIVGSPAHAREVAFGEHLRRAVADAGLAGVVEFSPGVPQRQLPDLYRRATVVLNATPTGSGDKVVLEALSCGVPCVFANRGFLPSLGPAARVLHFQEGEADDLARRLDGVLQMPALDRRRLGLTLRARVVIHHGLSGLAERLVGVLESVRSAGRERKGAAA